MFLFLELLAIIAIVVLAMQTRWGGKIGNFAPTPFWIYFIPILLATFGLLPHESPVYDTVSQRALPAALVLMLIGTPLAELFKLSGKAALSVGFAAITMLIAAVVSFIALYKFLPPGSDQVVGALLGTWVGGSANMLAVKEILRMPDGLMAPLIIVDTFLSYAWMAMLVVVSARQNRYDQWTGAPHEVLLPPRKEWTTGKTLSERCGGYAVVLVAGFFIGELAIRAGFLLGQDLSWLSARGWTIVLISVISLVLAATPLQKIERYGASKIGGYLLYIVLATIGVKTTLAAVREAPVYIMFGVLILMIHGVLMVVAGKWKRIPLFLLATGSQAAVGGPVSAPILAEVYRPGTSPIGVLMALCGAVAGTYVGLLGAWICHGISRIFL